MDAGAIMRVSAERKYLAAIRDFVRNQTYAAGVDTADTDCIIQAVDEAATNIILHGYRGNRGVIEIEVILLPDRIIVILRDNAPIFDPTQVPVPDINLPLEQRPVGGLGVHLIRKCVDEFTHTKSSQGGNELLLVKYLHKEDY